MIERVAKVGSMNIGVAAMTMKLNGVTDTG
jgi:hypothetical protein